MLTLTRSVGQSIKIGHDVTVVVTHIDRRGKVKLSFQAPRDVIITRTELLTRGEQHDLGGEG